MVKQYKFLITIISAFLLTACGGGGSSSSGSGSALYAGTYYGTLGVCATFGSEKACQNAKSSLTISVDGTVSSPSGQLGGRMNGNKYSFGGTGTGNAGGLTCNISVAGGGVVNGNNTTGTSSGTADCSDGNQYGIGYAWDMDKGSAKALNLPTLQEAFDIALSKLLSQG